MRPLVPGLVPSLLVAAASACLPLSAQQVPVAPVLPAFDAATFASPARNPWFPLVAGPARAFLGRTPDGEEERFVLAVQGPGPVILGVQTVAVLDEAFEADLLVERTLDYFAADAAGAVWYFGEDVTNYRYDEDDRLIGTDDESAWRAGVNGAVPGVVMPARPAPGGPVFQEQAPADEAMDWGRIDAVGLTVAGPAGTFADVVQVYESSTVEPGSRAYKYYAPDVGLIREEELGAAGGRVELLVDLQP